MPDIKFSKFGVDLVWMNVRFTFIMIDLRTLETVDLWKL